MLRNLVFLLTFIVITAAKAPGEDKAVAELKAAGMSQASIDSLIALSNKFPMGGSGQERAAFELENQKMLDAMPAADKTIYEEFKQKRRRSE